MEWPRFIADMDSPSNLYEMHIFADASAKAYACVVILRIISEPNKQPQTYLIFSKARIAKPNTFTILKLELLAVLLATQIMTFIRTAIPVTYSKQIIWSDSKYVLSWIRTHRILPVFIQRRIGTIRTMSEVSFHYVSTTTNPVDIPSRGATFNELQESIWWKGPSWLLEEAEWPTETYELNENEVNTEISPAPSKMALPVTQRIYRPPLQINTQRYSKYLHFIRITATVITFLKRISKDKVDVLASKTTLSVQAEFLWLKAEQKFHFAEVFTALRQNKEQDLISKHSLFVDVQGLLRCAHRLRN